MRLLPVHYRRGNWEFRPNICTSVGDQLRFHRHDHQHLSQCQFGRFKMLTLCLDGSTRQDIIASHRLGGGLFGSAFVIEAGIEHNFEVLELEPVDVANDPIISAILAENRHPNVDALAAMVCLWPEGIK